MKKIIFAISCAGLMTMAACKKDPANPNEQEQITRVVLSFTNTANSADVRTAEFSDPDGDGGNAPTQTDLTLADSSIYDGVVLLLDESKTPTDTISVEVLEEGDEHQLFYTASAGLGITTQYSDQDANGDPVGLSIRLTTAQAATGTYRVVLKHQPDGSKDGSEGTGETDLEVTFNLTIQ